MMSTWLTETFGLSVPVVGAPMAGPGDGRLAAAVSAGGGLGMVGVGGSHSRDWIQEQARVAATSGHPFGVGLMAWVLEGDDAQLEAVVDIKPALVSVSFGRCAEPVARLKEAGIRTASQVGNLDEAIEAERAGVDLLVARGGEAGGHGRNEVSTLVLLQQVLDRVSVPVIAAGGISTARGLAAVLAAGAVGAWVGTAFLGCTETASSPAARRRLLAGDSETVYGRVFDVAQRLGWPEEYGARGLRNSFFDTWMGRLDELATDESAATELVTARQAEDFDTAYLYAGQGIALLNRERSAADVLADLAGAEALLRRAGA